MPKIRSPWSLAALLKKRGEGGDSAPSSQNSSPATSSGGGSSSSSGKAARKAQQERSVLCPIMEKIMQDPVLALDGYTYERRAIEEWFRRGHRVSPVTYGGLGSVVVIPNEKLREVVEAFVEKKTRGQQDPGVRACRRATFLPPPNHPYACIPIHCPHTLHLTHTHPSTPPSPPTDRVQRVHGARRRDQDRAAHAGAPPPPARRPALHRRL